jgi:hypothetical protein
MCLRILGKPIYIPLSKVSNPNQNFAAWEIFYPGENKDYPNGIIKVFRVDKEKGYKPVDSAYQLWDFNNKCIEEHDSDGRLEKIHFYDENHNWYQTKDAYGNILTLNNKNGNPIYIVLKPSNEKNAPNLYYYILKKRIKVGLPKVDNPNQNYAVWEITYPEEDYKFPNGRIKVYRVDKSKNYKPVDETFRIYDFSNKRIA